MCSENQHTQGKADFSHDADAQRLDYAWKWFEYHAKQRVSMFNFFLVASGLFATAYVQALCAGEESLAIGISLLGVLIVVAFVGLDCRNAALAYLGEDVLRRLERDEFFADDFKGLNERLKEVEGGILYRDAHNPQIGRAHV